MKNFARNLCIASLLFVLASCTQGKYLSSLTPQYSYRLIISQDNIKYVVRTDSFGYAFAKHYLLTGSSLALYDVPHIGIIYDPSAKMLKYSKDVDIVQFCTIDTLLSK